MIYILCAVLLFGFIHPGSKVILDSGPPLSYFCISYVGIRFLIQIGIALASPRQFHLSSHLVVGLLLFGLIGAGLQFLEFKGIADGLSPGTVTFLMFSYPFWLALIKLFTHRQSTSLLGILQALLSVIGILFVTRGSLSEIQNQMGAILFPLLASLFIALWILQSTRLRSRGIKTLTLSLYYDLFSLAILLIILAQPLAQDYSEFTNWINLNGVLLMAGFSVFVGLLPNFLFYYGSQNVEPQVSGLAMSFEPVLSTLYSAMIWKYSFGFYFWFGAFFILLANIPLKIIKTQIKKAELWKSSTND